MDANSVFPGKDVDEMLENKEGLEDLDDKISFLRSTLDMDDLKALEEDGSEIAEEAMIAEARQEAGEETVDEVMSDDEAWKNNPRSALGRLEKALNYSDDAVKEGSLTRERANVFKTLLDNDHFFAARRFDRMVDARIERSEWRNDDIEEDQSREDMIKDRYDDLSIWTLDSVEKKRLMATYFDEVSMSESAQENLVIERYENGDYREAFSEAKEFGLETVEVGDEEKNVRDIVEDGYEEKMEEDNYIEAAKIAREAREVNDGEERDSYEELEKEAATQAFEESLENNDYEQAEKIANSYQVGDNEELQLKLSAARAKGELDDDQYETLSKRIGPDLSNDVDEDSETTEAYESESDSGSGYDSGVDEDSGTTEVYESEAESDDSSGGILSSIRSKL